MTSQRARAYGRVTKTLADLGPSKLHDGEAEVFRNAADALLFAEAEEEAARDALIDAHDLALKLVDADRLLGETAERLLADLAGCGPDIAVPAAA
jgi:hypothetical protein